MRPKRFTCARGQKLLPTQKLVGRNTRWGNPFPVVGTVDPGKPPRLVRRYAEKWGVQVDSLICETAEEAVRRHREALESGRLDYAIDDVREHLAGFDLGCPCRSPHCHAETLLELANS
jgi:hypothetical protein